MFKYHVIKNAVSFELANFIFNYFLLKRTVARTLFDQRYISQFTEEWGTWSDQQVPNTYSHYADIAMETLLIRCLDVMEKTTKLKLNPTYSYARIYKTGDILLDCLKSVLEQEAVKQVILVDNGNTRLLMQQIITIYI